MKKKILVGLLIACVLLNGFTMITLSNRSMDEKNDAIRDAHKQVGDKRSPDYEIQWSHNYGKLWWWSARYEGPQPVGDADNDGKNELLIGGRDPFMRVMKWDESKQTYYEQQKIIDPVFGIGYSILGFGSATGFSIADIDNDGMNEIGVAWGRHFSAFKWDGSRYEKIGMYVVTKNRGWETTLDCIVGDCDNDGRNEVVVTGGYNTLNTPEVLVLSWDEKEFIKKSEWSASGYSLSDIYFPWIADVDNDGENELIIGPGNSLVVLNWDGEKFVPTTLKTYDRHTQVFGCVAKDSNGNGIPDIHVTFGSPDLEIWEWNGSGYGIKYNHTWAGEDATIEAIDIGDVDYDGVPEVCVGTNFIHILQWNGTGYEEESTITETFGCLAVTVIGDFDNDRLNEINAGSVWASSDEPYMEWIFKFAGV
ncbi:MAG: FG-GAP-like repeat-containing protein [Candidatus Thermoplasmatota archaeon]|nr:FG-GAP-like repeat-containing protein [Candidatus Thermoplasmatota archaeon]